MAAGSTLGEWVTRKRDMGVATLKQPGSSPASAARGSERATRTETGHARARRRGWRGRRAWRRSLERVSESSERGARHYSPVHGTRSRPAGDGAEAQE